MITFLRKHPAASYFTLAFVLSWGGVLAVIAPGPIPAPPAEAAHLFAFVYLAMLVGPSGSGLLMTALVSGRSGLRALGGRLRRWRVGARWYAVALFTAPLALLATVALLSRFSPAFVPAILGGSTAALGPVRGGNLSSFLLVGLAVGLGAGFFEGFGWTGFAIPSLRRRLGENATGLLVGAVWGAWHFLAVLWGSAEAFGDTSVVVFMTVALFSFLPPYRMLMLGVYERTESLLVAVLMHASLTASMLLLGPVVSGRAAVIYDLVFGSVLWLLVLATRRWLRRA